MHGHSNESLIYVAPMMATVGVYFLVLSEISRRRGPGKMETFTFLNMACMLLLESIGFLLVLLHVLARRALVIYVTLLIAFFGFVTVKKIRSWYKPSHTDPSS